MKNQWIYPILTLLFLFIYGSISFSAWADCSFRNGTSTGIQHISIPSLSLDSTPAADTILWDSGVVMGTSIADIYCATEQTVTTGYQTAKTLVTGIATSNVYQTNNPGIGIRMMASANKQNLLAMTWGRGTEQAHAGYAYSQQMYFHAQLIATGKPLASGTLDLSDFKADRVFGSARQFLLSFSSSSITVRAFGCDLDTKDITVPLTTGRGAVITSLSTPGDTTTPARFDINLTCQKTTNVSIKFNGTTVSGKSNTLQLDNLSNSSSAKGVGVQVLNNGQPIDFGKQYDLLSNVTSTAITLSYQARLIRLSDAIQAGDVNATATFDMIYR